MGPVAHLTVIFSNIKNLRILVNLEEAQALEIIGDFVLDKWIFDAYNSVIVELCGYWAQAYYAQPTR